MSEYKHIPDQRTYAFHQKAAEILRKHPERLKDVHDVLAHWRTLAGTQAEAWAEKWQQLIEHLEVEDIAEFICKEGEEMDFYRKSSPFSCLLSDKERMEILVRFKYDYK